MSNRPDIVRARHSVSLFPEEWWARRLLVLRFGHWHRSRCSCLSGASPRGVCRGCPQPDRLPPRLGRRSQDPTCRDGREARAHRRLRPSRRIREHHSRRRVVRRALRTDPRRTSTSVGADDELRSSSSRWRSWHWRQLLCAAVRTARRLDLRKKGFKKIWGIEITAENAPWGEALLRAWTEEWQRVAVEVGIEWEGEPYTPADFENALCIWQERRYDSVGGASASGCALIPTPRAEGPAAS